jgi:hypothetical protein
MIITLHPLGRDPYEREYVDDGEYAIDGHVYPHLYIDGAMYDFRDWGPKNDGLHFYERERAGK